MPSALPEDVRAALVDGQKIEAIRLLRERTGLGLAEAKAAVESGSLPDAEAERGFAAPLPPEVSAAVAAGNKVHAIKLLRRAKGIGLKQAKDIVDEASRTRTPSGGRNPEGLSPGEVPRRSWSAGFVALILLVLGAAVWFLIKVTDLFSLK